MPKPKILKTLGEKLEVRLFGEELIQVVSPDYKKVGIWIRKIDPTDPTVPEKVKGAIYRISAYDPEDDTSPFDYGIAFVMPNGDVLSRTGSYLPKKNSC